MLICYKCPNCNHRWHEYYECACDSECPACETESIEPFVWAEEYQPQGPIHHVPYAVFRFEGESLHMDRPQFEQAVLDGRICKCGECLACRCLEYWRANQ